MTTVDYMKKATNTLAFLHKQRDAVEIALMKVNSALRKRALTLTEEEYERAKEKMEDGPADYVELFKKHQVMEGNAKADLKALKDAEEVVKAAISADTVEDVSIALIQLKSTNAMDAEVGKRAAGMRAEQLAATARQATKQASDGAADKPLADDNVPPTAAVWNFGALG